MYQITKKKIPNLVKVISYASAPLTKIQENGITYNIGIAQGEPQSPFKILIQTETPYPRAIHLMVNCFLQSKTGVHKVKKENYPVYGEIVFTQKNYLHYVPCTPLKNSDVFYHHYTLKCLLIEIDPATQLPFDPKEVFNRVEGLTCMIPIKLSLRSSNKVICFHTNGHNNISFHLENDFRDLVLVGEGPVLEEVINFSIETIPNIYNLSIMEFHFLLTPLQKSHSFSLLSKKGFLTDHTQSVFFRIHFQYRDLPLLDENDNTENPHIHSPSGGVSDDSYLEKSLTRRRMRSYSFSKEYSHTAKTDAILDPNSPPKENLESISLSNLNVNPTRTRARRGTFAAPPSPNEIPSSENFSSAPILESPPGDSRSILEPPPDDPMAQSQKAIDDSILSQSSETNDSNKPNKKKILFTTSSKSSRIYEYGRNQFNFTKVH